MSKTIILTDSTSDLNKETREKYGIEYVKMNYVLDGNEYPDSLDWEKHSVKEFYDFMRAGKHITTTQVPVKTYEDAFQSYIDNGDNVIYIACSSALSGSVNLAKKVVADMNAEDRIAVIDSLCSSLGQASMAITAATMIAEGKTFEETAAYIEETKLNVNQFGTVDSLEYLRRAGRVKAGSAFFGNLFGIKPIIISDINGQNYATEKVKGALNAKKRIADLIAEASEGYERKTLYITHADSQEDAELLKKAILEKATFDEVVVSTIGPIVGSCVGPGTLIAFCYGKKVTIEGK
ncbi:MAG: DegV family protein [Clostridia bacterium]|nr:DegV family protein [Clostridia bacterium]